jgi:hypothetical protein
MPRRAPQVGTWHAIEAVAPLLGVKATLAGVHDSADIESVIDSFATLTNGGLIVLPSPVVNLHRDLIITMAARHHLPAMYGYPYFAAEADCYLTVSIPPICSFARPPTWIAFCVVIRLATFRFSSPPNSSW